MFSNLCPILLQRTSMKQVLGPAIRLFLKLHAPATKKNQKHGTHKIVYVRSTEAKGVWSGLVSSIINNASGDCKNWVTWVT
jgi:hypothetical protein